jgi:hypothetical protein
VQSNTNLSSPSGQPILEGGNHEHPAAPIEQQRRDSLRSLNSLTSTGEPTSPELALSENTSSVGADLLLLQEAAALASLAARADALPAGTATEQALIQAEQALVILRRTYMSHTSNDTQKWK